MGQIRGDLSSLEGGCECFEEKRKSGTEFGWNCGGFRFPVGTNEKLFGIPFVIKMSKEHFGVDVAAIAG